MMRAGGRRSMARDKPCTAASESMAPAAMATGRREAPKLDRNSASRAALPATCCAIKSAEVTAAACAPGVSRGLTSRTLYSASGRVVVSGRFSAVQAQLLRCLLGARGADRRLDVLLLLRRRQHRRQSQRLKPQLSAPAARVIEVLVLFILDAAVGFLQRG